MIDDLGISHLTDLEVIGRGGFSRVYSATDTQLRRRVAVKVLDPVETDADRRRFDRECEVLGRLSSHPHIITVHSAGYASGDRPYLVMELVEGGSVHDQLADRGPIPWASAVALALPVSDALESAHRQGVLHRDIKPENILLDGANPRLADFGIAYLRDRGGATSTAITATWLHTAPETFDNQRDERSDVYSLASTLYTMLTGTPPFWREGETSMNPLLKRLLSDPAPPLPVGTAPPAVRELIEWSLAKDPTDRPQSAIAFGQALSAAASVVPPPTDATAVVGAAPVATVPGVAPSPPPQGLSPSSSGAGSPDASLAIADTVVAEAGQERRSGNPALRIGLAAATAVVAVAAAVGLFVIAGDGDGDGVVAATSPSSTSTTAALRPVDAADQQPTTSAGAPSSDPTGVAGAIDIAVLPELGTSVYDQQFQAEVLAVRTGARYTVDVDFDAAGLANLRDPASSCLRNEDTGAIAGTVAVDLSTDQPGRFIGTLSFPVLQSGRWSFQYSCTADYSLVPVAVVSTTGPGTSRFSDRFYATVVAFTRSGTALTVEFVAHGRDGLRAPETSCVSNGAVTITPTETILDREQPNMFAGRLVFTVDPAESSFAFTYSCSSDYPPVPLR